MRTLGPDAFDALRELLTAIEPYRAFKADSDALVHMVAHSPRSPANGGPQLARLEMAVRRARMALGFPEDSRRES